MERDILEFEALYPPPHGVAFDPKKKRYTGGHAFGYKVCDVTKQNIRLETYNKTLDMVISMCKLNKWIK